MRHGASAQAHDVEIAPVSGLIRCEGMLQLIFYELPPFQLSGMGVCYTRNCRDMLWHVGVPRATNARREKLPNTLCMSNVPKARPYILAVLRRGLGCPGVRTFWRWYVAGWGAQVSIAGGHVVGQRNSGTGGAWNGRTVRGRARSRCRNCPGLRANSLRTRHGASQCCLLKLFHSRNS